MIGTNRKIDMTREMQYMSYIKSTCNREVEHDEISIINSILNALEEIQQYRTLGTVEELKEAREKQVAKKPIIWENKSYEAPVPNDDWGYECPCCGNRDIDYPEHHCECGQALDWSEEDD